jgi:hypothetical protein
MQTAIPFFDLHVMNNVQNNHISIPDFPFLFSFEKLCTKKAIQKYKKNIKKENK